VHGAFGGMSLHCAASAGVLRLEAASFTGRELYLATHPLLSVALIQLLERRHRYCLHAACLARDGRGVLVAGPSGAGKSTLASRPRPWASRSCPTTWCSWSTMPRTTSALGFADAVGVMGPAQNSRRATASPALDPRRGRSPGRAARSLLRARRARLPAGGRGRTQPARPARFARGLAATGSRRPAHASRHGRGAPRGARGPGRAGRHVRAAVRSGPRSRCGACRRPGAQRARA
jgi:hypothetical protein